MSDKHTGSPDGAGADLGRSSERDKVLSQQAYACLKPLHMCNTCRDIAQILAMGDMTKQEILDFLGDSISKLLLEFHLNGLLTKGHVRNEEELYCLARGNYIEEVLMRIAASGNNSPKTREQLLEDERFEGIPKTELLLAIERLRLNNCLVLFWRDQEQVTSSLRAYLAKFKEQDGSVATEEPQELYRLGMRGASILKVCGICANRVEDGSVIVETIHEEINPDGDAYVVPFHPQCYASHLDPGKQNGVGFCRHCGLPLTLKLLNHMLLGEQIPEDGDTWPSSLFDEPLEIREQLWLSAVQELFDPASRLLSLNKHTVFKASAHAPSMDRGDIDDNGTNDSVSADDLDLEWINGAAMVIQRGPYFYHPYCWEILSKDGTKRKHVSRH